MQEGPNPRLPTPDAVGDGGQARIIEELKAAGEELKVKEVSPFSPAEVSTKASAKIMKGKPSFAKATAGEEEEVDLFEKIGKYQKEISQEQSVLEKTFQEVRELEKKLEQRIELLKRLQNKSIEIHKEFKNFQEQLALAKKENKGLLNEVKSHLQSL